MKKLENYQQDKGKITPPDVCYIMKIKNQKSLSINSS